jgi:hypothetical protein
MNIMISFEVFYHHHQKEYRPSATKTTESWMDHTNGML